MRRSTTLARLSACGALLLAACSRPEQAERSIGGSGGAGSRVAPAAAEAPHSLGDFLSLAERRPARAAGSGYVVDGGHLRGTVSTAGRRLVRSETHIEARLLGDAASPFELVTAHGFGARVTRVGASPSAAASERGAVTYRDAWASVDATVLATASGVEELLVARGPRREAAYRVDLPPGYRLVQPDARLALVELRDARDRARLRFTALQAWDARDVAVTTTVRVRGDTIALALPADAVFPVTIDPEWRSTGEMVLDRTTHTATLLGTGQVLLTGGDVLGLGLAELYDPQTETFTATGSLGVPRRGGHTATLLHSGKVLVAGGFPYSDSCLAVDASACVAAPLRAAELYDPGSGTFEPLGAKLDTARAEHAATILTDGAVLLTGGEMDAASRQSSAEVFDPATLRFRTAGSLVASRAGHSATLLTNGKILIVSGTYGPSLPTSDDAPGAELFDVGTGTSEGMTSPDSPGHVFGAAAVVGDQAALLPTGAVATSSWIFDPALDEWFRSTCTGEARVDRTFNATLLPTGDLLFTGRPGAWLEPQDGSPCVEIGEGAVTAPAGGAGGMGGGGYCDFNPQDPLCQPADSKGALYPGTATLLPSGAVLIAGEEGTSLLLPTTEHRVTTGAANFPRVNHAAALLDSGKILFAGGEPDPTGAEVFEPDTGRFEPVGGMSVARGIVTTGNGVDSSAPVDAHAVPLASGLVAVVGGAPPGSLTGATIDWFHPSTQTFSSVAFPKGYPGAPIVTAEDAVVMDDGRLLLASSPYSSFTALYVLDPGTGNATPVSTPYLPPSFSTTSPRIFGWHPGLWLVVNRGGVLLATAHALAPVPFPHAFAYDPAVAVLSPEAVLIAAGTQTSVFTPSGALVPTGTLASDHGDGVSATMLGSGQVLIAGGGTAAAELYEPTTGMVNPTGSMAAPRDHHTTTVLGSGQVLFSSSGTAETYDPDTGQFQDVAVTPAPREGQSATLLPDGRVLFAGGEDGTGSSSETELYDPETDRITPGPALKTGRAHHSATLLASGAVLLAGGDAAGTAELFSPDAGAVTTAGSLRTPRARHAATLLTSGALLVTGGVGSDGKRLATAEVFDSTTGASAPAPSFAEPRADHAAVTLPSGEVLLVGGTADGSSALELYAPEPALPDGVSTPIAGPSLVGPVRALLTPDDDVFVYGDGTTFRYEAASRAIVGLEVGPSKPFGVASLMSGGLLACAQQSCEFRLSSTSAPVNVAHRAATGGSLTALVSGDVLVRGRNAIGGGYTLRYGRWPKAAIRPRLASPGRVVAGSEVQIRAEGLQRMSAVGSEGVGTRPELFPVLYFVPASTGVPIALSTSSYADDRVSVRVPTTSRSGPGWLYAVVGGVPSEGAFTVVDPAPNGGACHLDTECAAGHCTEGVCCDQACSGGCQSCRQSRTGLEEGRCGNIPAGDSPRFGCVKLPDDPCSPTGACGAAGECELPAETQTCTTPSGNLGLCRATACVDPPAAKCDPGGTELRSPFGDLEPPTPCTPFRCVLGRCLDTCESDADCLESFSCTSAKSCRACTEDRGAVQLEGTQTKSCGDYVCESGECLTTCVSDVDCRPWSACRAQRCVAACDEAGEGILQSGGDGTQSASCAPFRCREGICLSKCESHADCARSYRCGTTGRCEPDTLSLEAPAAVGCACRIGAFGGGRNGALGPLAALSALALARRRRRASPRRRGGFR